MALKIGGVSARSGINVETIRYYERIGLLPPPGRNAGNQRIYEQSDLERLQFIKRARQLGFSLDDVRFMLNMVDGEVHCDEIKRLAECHIGAIREKIEDLKRLETTLADIAAQCSGEDTPHCPLIEALQTPGLAPQ